MNKTKILNVELDNVSIKKDTLVDVLVRREVGQN